MYSHFASFLILSGWTGGGVLVLAVTVNPRIKAGWLPRLAAFFLSSVFFAGAAHLIFEESSIGFLGGTARNGKIEAGRFYVGDHGRFREVSWEVFDKNLRDESVSDFVFAGCLAMAFLSFVIALAAKRRSSEKSS